MRARAVALAVAIVLAPLGAKAADLVVWWEKGFYPQEDEAVAEIVDAFEQETGKQVELGFYGPQAAFLEKIVAALEADRPPDFAFGLSLNDYLGQWALEDRLVDLSRAVGPVWKSLLERAGFTLEDIPREWEAFWSFWCDRVQPAARQALGRDDIWGIGLSMFPEAGDTDVQFAQFATAYEADYVTPDGRLVIDNPEIRQRLIKAIEGYTALYRKGCTPPDARTWASIDNNKAFHAQRVIMTPNDTLSIPNALKRERREDYDQNVATIDWPLGPRGELFPIYGDVFVAVIFKSGGNVGTAEEFVRFLVAEGWLAHYLDFAGERMLPPISKLLDQPFWLDPSDRHRMAAVMQVSSRPLRHNYAAASGNWRHGRVNWENVWPKAIQRVAAEGISPEQAVDEAITRIKQILSE
jgi:multiple sugar transport system substrate-binding protein